MTPLPASQALDAVHVSILLAHCFRLMAVCWEVLHDSERAGIAYHACLDQLHSCGVAAVPRMDAGSVASAPLKTLLHLCERGCVAARSTLPLTPRCSLMLVPHATDGVAGPSRSNPAAAACIAGNAPGRDAAPGHETSAPLAQLDLEEGSLSLGSLSLSDDGVYSVVTHPGMLSAVDDATSRRAHHSALRKDVSPPRSGSPTKTVHFDDSVSTIAASAGGTISDGRPPPLLSPDDLGAADRPTRRRVFSPLRPASAMHPALPSSLSVLFHTPWSAAPTFTAASPAPGVPVDVRVFHGLHFADVEALPVASSPRTASQPPVVRAGFLDARLHVRGLSGTLSKPTGRGIAEAVAVASQRHVGSVPASSPVRAASAATTSAAGGRQAAPRPAPFARTPALFAVRPGVPLSQQVQQDHLLSIADTRGRSQAAFTGAAEHVPPADSVAPAASQPAIARTLSQYDVHTPAVGTALPLWNRAGAPSFVNRQQWLDCTHKSLLPGIAPSTKQPTSLRRSASAAKSSRARSGEVRLRGSEPPTLQFHSTSAAAAGVFRPRTSTGTRGVVR